MIWFKFRPISLSLLRRGLKFFQVSGEAPIRLGDELFVKPLLAPAGFVAGDEQDCLTLRIEGEGGAPLSIRGLEAQLLHVGVLRAFERISIRSPELRAIIDQQPGCGEQRVLDLLLKGKKLRLEGILEFNVPGHLYSFQAMSCQWPGEARREGSVISRRAAAHGPSSRAAQGTQGRCRRSGHEPASASYAARP